MSTYSKEFKEEADKYNIPVIEITDRYDIDEITEKALGIIKGWSSHGTRIIC